MAWKASIWFQISGYTASHKGVLSELLEDRLKLDELDEQLGELVEDGQELGELVADSLGLGESVLGLGEFKPCSSSNDLLRSDLFL